MSNDPYRVHAVFYPYVVRRVAFMSQSTLYDVGVREELISNNPMNRGENARKQSRFLVAEQDLMDITKYRRHISSVVPHLAQLPELKCTNLASPCGNGYNC